MAIQKITLFFEDNAQQGWSESYYKEAASPTALTIIDDLGNSVLDQLRTARRAILGRNYTLRYARVSDETIRGDSIFRAYTPTEGAGTAQIGTLPASADEQVFDAVNMRLGTLAGITRRSLLVRGLPGGAIRQDRSVTDNFKQLVTNNFQLRLVAASFGIKRVAFAGDQQVAAITIRPDLRSLLIVPANALVGVVKGSIIQLKGTKSTMAYADGRWRVDRVDGVAITTSPRIRRVIGTYPANGPAVVQIATVTLQNITDVQVLAATRKDTGRPSYVPRGRRSVQRN